MNDQPKQLGPMQSDDLTALGYRSIRWKERRWRDRQTLQEMLDKVGGTDTPTALPPVPLPVVPRITFLSTVAEIIEEGVRMQHCIAEEASGAVKGYCFLFHVEHRGEHASVEVLPNGEVWEARGPRGPGSSQFGQVSPARRKAKWKTGNRKPEIRNRRMHGPAPFARFPFPVSGFLFFILRQSGSLAV